MKDQFLPTNFVRNVSVRKWNSLCWPIFWFIWSWWFQWQSLVSINFQTVLKGNYNADVSFQPSMYIQDNNSLKNRLERFPRKRRLMSSHGNLPLVHLLPWSLPRSFSIACTNCTTDGFTLLPIYWKVMKRIKRKTSDLKKCKTFFNKMVVNFELRQVHPDSGFLNLFFNLVSYLIVLRQK